MDNDDLIINEESFPHGISCPACLGALTTENALRVPLVVETKSELYVIACMTCVLENKLDLTGFPGFPSLPPQGDSLY